MHAESFPKRDRLRKRADYLDVQRAGRKVQSDHFLLLLLTHREPEGGPPTRVGVTVSSRVGNAVVRNRAKRRIREYVRRHRDALPKGDLVIVAKSSAATCAHAVLDRDLERLLQRARAVAGTRRPEEK